MCLLVKHYTGLWLSGSISILLSFVKDGFAGYRILGGQIFFSTVNMPVHSSVASIVSEWIHLYNFYLFIEVFKIH